MLRHENRSRVFAVSILCAALLAAAAPASAQSDCSVVGQNTFVRDTLRDIYLWYSALPDLDPALFESPEAYLDAVRFRPLDESFSYIASQQASDAYYSASQFIGIGFSSKQAGPRELRVSQVFPDSPASEAGLARGDYLVAINGRRVEDLLASGEIDAAFGPSEIGVSVELAWRTPRGEERVALVTKRPVTIPTVSQTAVFDLDGLPVGYVHLRNFVEPSVEALDQAFADFRTRGVVDVILDLRYNGGGLISVARHLGGLVGGVRTDTKIFVELVHNDKNTFRNRQLRFESPQATLDLRRLVVIATRASASSSELVINGLKPFVTVAVIGDRTFGKPVGQYGFDFCDKVLFPVSFESRNAVGEGAFYDGLAADCSATDGLDRPLGHPEEASLAEALHFLKTGSCSPSASGAARTLSRLRVEVPLRPAGGWARLVNAW